MTNPDPNPVRVYTPRPDLIEAHERLDLLLTLRGGDRHEPVMLVTGRERAEFTLKMRDLASRDFQYRDGSTNITVSNEPGPHVPWVPPDDFPYAPIHKPRPMSAEDRKRARGLRNRKAKLLKAQRRKAKR